MSRLAPTLKGVLITLRQIEICDRPLLKEILNDRVTMESLIPFFGVDTWNDQMVKTRYDQFQRVQDDGHGLGFVVEQNIDKSIAGSCGLKGIDSKHGQAEVGIILHRSVWGKGVARECHFLLLSYAFEELKLKSIFFDTYEKNFRMQGFFAKYSIPLLGPTEDRHLRYELTHAKWPSVRAMLSV